MILGLPRGEVRLVPHPEGWKRAFSRERRLLAAALGRRAAAIEHVGSTAVPGLAAKPILDIAVAVPSLRRIGAWPRLLEAEGYTFFGDREGWGEQFFAKGPEDRRTVYLHVVERGSRRWRDYLSFRDRLAGSPRLSARYAALKARAAARAADRKAYTAAKERFIRRVIGRRPA
jgi:GrpB-like predicted nucleotidyltransferase (UPF0157 family)